MPRIFKRYIYEIFIKINIIKIEISKCCILICHPYFNSKMCKECSLFKLGFVTEKECSKSKEARRRKNQYYFMALKLSMTLKEYVAFNLRKNQNH